MVLGLGVTVEEAADESHEGDTLELAGSLPAVGFLLSAEKRLEAVRIAEGVGCERGHNLTETYIVIGEWGRATLGAQEDGPDHRTAPSDWHHNYRAHVPESQEHLGALEHGVGAGVGDEDGLAAIEGALQLGVALQVHHEIAQTWVFIRRHEAHVPLVAEQEDGASVKTECFSETLGD